MSHDESVEFEAVQDGCARFVGSLEQAKAFAESEGPWAFSIYEVRRKLVWKSGASGSLAAPVPDAHPNTGAHPPVAEPVYCGCGDQIVKDDGAMCGTCVMMKRPEARADAGWISVEDRLPEKFVEVLIAFADCTLPATAQYTGNPHDIEGWCYPSENRGDGFDWTVTHWMPLPLTPTELAASPLSPEAQEPKT